MKEISQRRKKTREHNYKFQKTAENLSMVKYSIRKNESSFGLVIAITKS